MSHTVNYKRWAKIPTIGRVFSRTGSWIEAWRPATHRKQLNERNIWGPALQKLNKKSETTTSDCVYLLELQQTASTMWRCYCIMACDATANQPVLGGWSSPDGSQRKAAAAGKSSSSGGWAGRHEGVQPVVCRSTSVPMGHSRVHLVAFLRNSKIHMRENGGSAQDLR